MSGLTTPRADCLENLCVSKIPDAFPWMPDGKVPVVPNLDRPGHWIMFWPGGVSYRSLSESAFPEDHHGLELDPPGCAASALPGRRRCCAGVCYR